VLLQEAHEKVDAQKPGDRGRNESDGDDDEASIYPPAEEYENNYSSRVAQSFLMDEDFLPIF
jgi:hypothetical protein